jgi:RimJ/RimL family protein N-acetyltransferase
MDIPTIETKRLRLRAFTIDDWEPYAGMYADQSFVRYLGGKPLTKGEVWENLAVILGHWALLGYGIWAIERLDTGELVGRAGLLNLPGWPDVEVCWALSPRFWGNGYATEAARASIVWAFEEGGLHRLISLIHPENGASEAVALRLGETYREQITFEGKPTNVYEIINPRRLTVVARESPSR